MRQEAIEGDEIVHDRKKSIDIKMPTQEEGDDLEVDNEEEMEVSSMKKDEIQEEIDIDLDAPETQEAATKIQASFRGSQARKEVQKLKQEKEKEVELEMEMEEDVIDIDLDAPETQEAATKIQASFRGSQARKEVEKMKEEKKDLEKAAEPTEEIDIDLDAPETQEAATKIQASFRGSQARKEVKKIKEATENTEDKAEVVEEAKEGGVEETQEEIDIDLDAPETQEAATKIQASFRGSQARKEVQKMKEAKETEPDADNIEDPNAQEDAEKAEEIDIDLDAPETQEAATKIQASFRGSQARREVQKMKESKVEDAADSKDDKKVENKEIGGHEQKDEEKDQVADEEIIDIDLDAPETQEAATKIQASFRGSQARKEVQKMKETKEADEVTAEVEKEKAEVCEEEIDIDLDAPETQEAATKIQASFRGSQARKEVQKMKETKETDEKSQGAEIPATGNLEEEIDIDLDAPETQEAATKIQASFRGSQARKEVQKMKETKEADEKAQVAEIPATENIEEEIDIDLDAPETQEAATKIQASFRGSQARKEVEKMKETKEADAKAQEVGMPVTENLEEEIDIDLDAPETQEAATKIQASFRGSQARKEVKKMKKATEVTEDVSKVVQEGAEEAQIDEKYIEKTAEENEEVIDIDLNDPEVEAAATKIQAGFKGMKTRKEISEMQKTDIDMSNEPKKVAEVKDTEDEIDIDLNDPEVAEAATKIQAGYKGMKTRKKMRSKQEEIVSETGSKTEEEEIDTDLGDPEVEMAATKIQAGYKGMRTRKEMKKKMEGEAIGAPKAESSQEDESEEDKAATKIQAGFRGMQQRKKIKSKQLGEISEQPEAIQEEDEEKAEETESGNKAEEEIDIDLNDPEVEAAATKIQAGYKGMMTRKEMKSTEVKPSDSETPAVKEEEEIDIDLEDPEVAAAATKIQAGYKGMKTRKGLKEKNVEQDGEVTEKDSTEAKEADGNIVEEEQKVSQKEDEEIDIDLDDPEVAAAATKIQAGYKGMKTRKEMKGQAAKDEMTSDDTNQQITAIKTDRDGNNVDVTKKDEDTKDGIGNVMEEMKEDAEATKKDQAQEIDIDLEDPEVAAAATKIQAGYKGMKTRKELKDRPAADGSEVTDVASESTPEQEALPQNVKEEEEIDIDLDDPEVAAAATKIQAGYKGMKTRKELKSEPKEEEQSEDSKKDTLDAPDAPIDPEEGSTELLIQEGAEADAQDVRTETADDGYTSPELTLTTSSIPGSPSKKKPQLELTGTAAHIHDPNSEMLSTMVSQDSVTDTDLMEMNIEFPTLEEPTGFHISQDVLHEELPEDDKEDNGSSKKSSMMTVANAEDFNSAEEKTIEIPQESEKQDDMATKDTDEQEGEKVKSDTEGRSSDQVDKPEEVSEVGAVPLERHEGHPQVQEMTATKPPVEVAEEKMKGEQVVLYYSRGSYTSEKVLVYLYERGIDFTSFNVDLSKGEQFSKWFLKINPKAEVPVLTITDNTKDPSDPRYYKVITDSTRIMHSLDAKYTDIPAPNLVPSSSDTLAYQHHVYFTAIFDQVNEPKSWSW